MHVAVHDAERLIVLRNVTWFDMFEDSIPNFVVMDHLFVGFLLFLFESFAGIMESSNLLAELGHKRFVKVELWSETLGHRSWIGCHNVDTEKVGGDYTRLDEGTRQSICVLGDVVNEFHFLSSEFIHILAIEIIDWLGLKVAFLTVLKRHREHNTVVTFDQFEVSEAIAPVLSQKLLNFFIKTLT